MSVATAPTFDRDYLAFQYARRHLKTDSGVDRIFYLPTEAPDREIRLLEVNHLIAETTPLEAIDFGVDTGSAESHVLTVLDVTPDQWKAINSEMLSLPHGWTLEGMQEIGKR